MKPFVDSYIYLYHLDKFCILPDYPETVTDNMPSKFAETNALARTAPVFSYIQSGPRTVTVTFDMHRDMMNDLNKNVSNLKDNVLDFSGRDYVDTLIGYLQAASLPKYNEFSSGSKTVIPPVVAIRFANSIFIKGVITSGVNVTYKKPILVDGKYAQVSVTITISEVEPYDADYVKQQGSFRGLIRTFKNGIYKDTTDSPTVNVAQNTNSNSGTSLTGTVKTTVKEQKKQTIDTTTTKKKYTFVKTGID